MAPLLHKRHRQEARDAARIQRELSTEGERVSVSTQTAGGDPRYRLPAIGLNAGALPGTRPDCAVR